MTAYDCPNCGEEHGPLDCCFLGLLVAVVRDRGHDEEDVVKAAEGANADMLWERFGGPAADWLEDQLTEEGQDA